MKKILQCAVVIVSLLFTLVTGIANASAENASNPLSSVNNTDLRVRFYELTNDTNRTDYDIEGAYMVTPKFKLTYELHYWDADVTSMLKYPLTGKTIMLFPQRPKFR